MSALKKEKEDLTQLSEETFHMLVILKTMENERKEATKEGDMCKLMVVNEAEKRVKMQLNGLLKNELWMMRSSLYGLRRVARLHKMMGDEKRYSQCINIGLNYQKLINSMEDEVEEFGYEKSGALV